MRQTHCVNVRRMPWRAAGTCGWATGAWAVDVGCSVARTARAAALPGCPRRCWWRAPSAPAMCSNLDARIMRLRKRNRQKNKERYHGWTLTLCDGHDSREGHYEVGGLLVHVVGCVDVGESADRRKTSTGYRDLERENTLRVQLQKNGKTECNCLLYKMSRIPLSQLYSYLKKVSEPWETHRGFIWIVERGGHAQTTVWRLR